MSIHSSLRGSPKGKKHRSVLKRYERLKVLKEKGAWGPEMSVLGLSKVKIQKIKVRKEKSATETAAASVAAGKPGETAAPAAVAPAKGGSLPVRQAGASGGKTEKK